MYHFCSYFDSNYLIRGLTLYRSLQSTNCAFKLYALALDDRTFSVLSDLCLPNLHPISLSAIESFEPALLTAKKNRGPIEYYFTLSPILPLYVLANYSAPDIITYLDADLYFYQSPSPIFEELGTGSILITEHRFPEYLREKEKYGRFNVQYQSFRRDQQGIACLERWKEQCLEWCYDRLEDNKFADQKYLDEWPKLYGDLVISRLKGVGVAPWNWAVSPLSIDSSANLIADGELIIFYHFHGVKIFNRHFISNGLLDFGLMPNKIRRYLYGNYLRQLSQTLDWLNSNQICGFELKDHFARRKGLGISSMREILRKAWAQSMFFFN